MSVRAVQPYPRLTHYMLYQLLCILFALNGKMDVTKERSLLLKNVKNVTIEWNLTPMTRI